MKRNNGWAVDPNLRTILRDIGVEPADVLRRARLPEDLLARESQRLPSADYYRMWNAVVELADIPAFPIAAASRITSEGFSPLLFAALCSPDYATALGRISMFKPLVAPITLHVEERTMDFTLSLEWWEDDPRPPESLILMELAFFVALARMGTREEIYPTFAGAPDLSPVTTEYVEYFGVEVQPAQRPTLTFSMADARRPFLTANEGIWETFAPELRRRLADLDSTATVTDRVDAVLLEYLPSGLASMDAVAEKLIMSKRTLQRKLHAEGTTFQEVLKNVRHELAEHYLKNSRLTATEISYLIGFEDANSFFRAFSDWTGNTPTAVREAALSAN